jgi:hypothetical protein
MREDCWITSSLRQQPELEQQQELRLERQQVQQQVQQQELRQSFVRKRQEPAGQQ